MDSGCWIYQTINHLSKFQFQRKVCETCFSQLIIFSMIKSIHNTIHMESGGDKTTPSLSSCTQTSTIQTTPAKQNEHGDFQALKEHSYTHKKPSSI